jgi:hypothetical protein
MKKRPSHSLKRRFSSECCAKNTQAIAAQMLTATKVMEDGIAIIYQKLMV